MLVIRQKVLKNQGKTRARPKKHIISYPSIISSWTKSVVTVDGKEFKLPNDEMIISEEDKIGADFCTSCVTISTTPKGMRNWAQTGARS